MNAVANCDIFKYSPLGSRLDLQFSKEEREVHAGLDWWAKIRLEVSWEESSKREILRDEGLETLKKISEYPGPLVIVWKSLARSRRLPPSLSGLFKPSEKTESYRRKSATSPSGSTTVCGRWATKGNAPGWRVARELLRVMQEGFILLIRRMREAWVDFGHALAIVSAVLREFSS